MSGDPVITLEDVAVEFEKDQGFLESLFDDPETVGAVDDVSLEIPENDVVALVGESGCGKTTLGKTAIGVQRPTGGTVAYRGQDLWGTRDGDVSGEYEFAEMRRSLQVVHQDPGAALNPNQTVLDSLVAPLKRWETELSVADRRARVHSLLERVGMEPADDYAHRYPHQLSGGEKQRVALVRALLLNPDLILADEAVSALDVSLRVEMMDLMLDLQDEFGTSYLFISHNLSNARYLAEKADGRVGIMYLGELVELGPADEVLRDPKHPYTEVLKWATADLDPDPIVRNPPVRSIDIPDPVDPPSGCRFHTRCPKVVPPTDTDIGQETYNRVMDLRGAVDARTLDREALAATGDADARLAAAGLADLPAPHGDRIDDALSHVASGEWDAAAEALSESYESPCETTPPAVDGRSREHTVACHLYHDHADAPGAGTDLGVETGGTGDRPEGESHGD
ncbi:ABC transporter ATP-binding protein [Halorarum halophilum]|uniref:ABC transporter ATP-binding protein n=1 Tax=Halorarum halophilum TaxID=2743090 RepID=A0A7D5KN78_9EURY|nr:ABC transporter ATP-binding protein [Halobaculum halophilum]